MLAKLSTAYTQYTHLISIRQARNLHVLIADNHFHNISMAGSLIYYAEYIDEKNSSLALINNTFEVVQGYVGTNIIEVRRNYTSLEVYDPDLIL